MHAIRLRGPWDSQPLAGDPPAGTRHVRRFNCPTNLTPGQRVWLVIDDMPGLARAILNAAEVGQVSNLPAPPCPIRIEIAALLRPRNELVLEASGEQGLGEVRLEIE
jgi:hypothetical protein